MDIRQGHLSRLTTWPCYVHIMDMYARQEKALFIACPNCGWHWLMALARRVGQDVRNWRTSRAEGIVDRAAVLPVQRVRAKEPAGESEMSGLVTEAKIDRKSVV